MERRKLPASACMNWCCTLGSPSVHDAFPAPGPCSPTRTFALGCRSGNEFDRFERRSILGLVMRDCDACEVSRRGQAPSFRPVLQDYVNFADVPLRRWNTPIRNDTRAAPFARGLVKRSDGVGDAPPGWRAGRADPRRADGRVGEQGPRFARLFFGWVFWKPGEQDCRGLWDQGFRDHGMRQRIATRQGSCRTTTGSSRSGTHSCGCGPTGRCRSGRPQPPYRASRSTNRRGPPGW